MSAGGDSSLMATGATPASAGARTGAGAAEVQFEMTPRIQRAIAKVLDDAKGKNDPELSATLSPYRGAAASFDSAPLAIPLSHLQLLSRVFRPLAERAVDGHSGWVHELTVGSAIVAADAPKAKKRNPEHEAFLARMRVKASKREYEAMVQNIRPRETVFDTLSGGAVDADPGASTGRRGGGGGSAAGNPSITKPSGNPFREAAVGMNVIVVMLTGFVVFWYAGRQYFITDLNPHSVKPVLCGVVGLISALLLEVTLLIVRDQKHQMHDARKFARANPGVPNTRPAGGEVSIMSGADPAGGAAPAAAADTHTPSAASAAAAAAGGVGTGGGATDPDTEMSILKQRLAAGRQQPAAPAVFEPLSFGSRLKAN